MECSHRKPINFRCRVTVDLIFVDPPFNIGKRFSQFLDKWQSDVEYVKWCEG